MKGRRKAFVKVKLVHVNIRFKLDISMPVMVINLELGLGHDTCSPSSSCHSLGAFFKKFYFNPYNLLVSL